MVAILRLIKYLLVVLITVTVAAILTLAYYDYQYFQPVVKQYNVDSSYPNSVSKLLDTEYGGSSLKYLVARELLEKVRSGDAFNGHLHTAIWGEFANFHLSHDKQLNIIISNVYLGEKTYGFSDAANKFFNKPLNDLSPKEIALLVARIKAPSVYSRHPEKLEQRAKHILKSAGYES